MIVSAEINNWLSWLVWLVGGVAPLFWAYCDLNCGGCRRRCYHSVQPKPKPLPLPSLLKGFREVDQLAQTLQANHRVREALTKQFVPLRLQWPVGISTQGFKEIDRLAEKLSALTKKGEKE